MKYIDEELNHIDVQESISVEMLQRESVLNIFPNRISVEARGRATLLRKNLFWPNVNISRELSESGCRHRFWQSFAPAGLQKRLSPQTVRNTCYKTREIHMKKSKNTFCKSACPHKLLPRCQIPNNLSLDRL